MRLGDNRLLNTVGGVPNTRAGQDKECGDANHNNQQNF
jgi:hypothetical protein